MNVLVCFPGCAPGSACHADFALAAKTTLPNKLASQAWGAMPRGQLMAAWQMQGQGGVAGREEGLQGRGMKLLEQLRQSASQQKCLVSAAVPQGL